MCDLNEWTPSPGYYNVKSNFVKKTAQRIETTKNNENETVEKVVEYIPWDQPGLR